MYVTIYERKVTDDGDYLDNDAMSTVYRFDNPRSAAQFMEGFGLTEFSNSQYETHGFYTCPDGPTIIDYGSPFRIEYTATVQGTIAQWRAVYRFLTHRKIAA